MTDRQRVLVLALACLIVSACQSALREPQSADPEPFPGIANQLGRFGVEVSSWTSGDPGCDDPTLSPTAIRFDATGLDQAAPVLLRIYIFRNRDAWTRRSADVDACVATWATDPATFELLSISPYVVAGQGPWPPGFKDALRKGLAEAAGNGG